MGTFVRGLFLVICAVGGVMGAFRVLNEVVQHADPSATTFQMQDGGIFLMIPVGVVGALLGAFFGGMLLPRRR